MHRDHRILREVDRKVQSWEGSDLVGTSGCSGQRSEAYDAQEHRRPHGECSYACWGASQLSAELSASSPVVSRWAVCNLTALQSPRSLQLRAIFLEERDHRSDGIFS